MWQIDIARYHRRAGKAGQRSGAGRQSTGPRAGPASASDVSGIGAVSVAEYFRQRDVRSAVKAWLAQFRAARSGKILSSPSRVGKIHGNKRARAFRRNETARGA